MNTLQKALEQIAQRLRDITTSQRIALLLGGVLAGGALIWLAQWAATPEMTPLLLMDLPAEELARVRSGLDAMREPYRIDGSKVLVRAKANAPAILAQLQLNNSMPANTSDGFEALVKESNPWVSQADNDRRWTYALSKELERVLAELAGVRSARVILPVTQHRPRFARTEAPSSASVTLIMENGAPVPRELALAAARLVSGAVRGLPLKNVQVVDANGVSALDWEQESSDSADYLNRERVKIERQIEDKIRAQLADPKVRVSVQVDLDLTRRNNRTVTPIAGVEVSEQTSAQRTNRTRRAGEPGVTPNTAIAANGGPGVDETSETETTRTEKEPGRETKLEETPAGTVKEVHAAINVSYGYLENIFKRANAAAAAPTEAQVEELFEREKKHILSQVMRLVKPQQEENVAVDWYYDVVEAPPATQASSMDEALGMVKTWAPQGGLALLALFALGLMFRMTRKSHDAEAFGLELGLPKEAIDAARQASADAMSAARQRAKAAAVAVQRSGAATAAGGGLDGAGPAPVGNAAATEGVLVAQEVDETMIQSRKMVEQVSQIVESDPEGVASLLHQWISRDDGFESGG